MSASGDSQDEIRGIAEKIINWVEGVRWGDQQDELAERVIAELDRSPDKYIDSTLSASANYERVKEQFGLRTQTERQNYIRDMRERDKQRAFDEIRAQLEEFGLEAVVAAVARDDPANVPDELEERVDQVLEVLPPDAYDGVIQDYTSDVLAEIAPQLVVNNRRTLEREREAGRQQGLAEAREILEDTFGREFNSVEDAAAFFDRRVRQALENEEELREEAQRAAEQAILEGLGETFNEEFNTVADARRAIRQRAKREGEREVLNDISRILGQEVMSTEDAIDALREELGLVPDDPNERAEVAIDLLEGN